MFSGGNDFTGADPIRVDFAAFEQCVSITSPLINDNVAEPMEMFRVELEVPSEFTARNITVGGKIRTTVSINDDDCVTVTITSDEVGTTEGSNLPLTVTVDGDFSEPFEVAITMSDGTATGMSMITIYIVILSNLLDSPPCYVLPASSTHNTW